MSLSLPKCGQGGGRRRRGRQVPAALSDLHPGWPRRPLAPRRPGQVSVPTDKAHQHHLMEGRRPSPAHYWPKGIAMSNARRPAPFEGPQGLRFAHTNTPTPAIAAVPFPARGDACGGLRRKRRQDGAGLEAGPSLRAAAPATIAIHRIIDIPGAPRKRRGPWGKAGFCGSLHDFHNEEQPACSPRPEGQHAWGVQVRAPLSRLLRRSCSRRQAGVPP
jgi:hypothetical protein